MNCKKVKKFLMDYIEGKLSDKLLNEMEIHIENCSDCKNLLNDFQFIIENSKKIKTPELMEDFWKEKVKFYKEKTIQVRNFRPVFIAVSLLPILLFSSILFFKLNFIPKSSEEKKSVVISLFDEELLFSEEEFIKYADYIDEKDVENIIDFILDQSKFSHF